MHETRPSAAVVLLVLLAWLCALHPVGATAQGWSVSAAAGRLDHEALGERIESLSTTLGLFYDGPQWLYVSAGIPFDSDAVGWAAGGVGTRLSLQRVVELGLDSGAHLFGYRDWTDETVGQGVMLEALPYVGTGVGPLRLEVASGVQYQMNRDREERVSRAVHRSDARLSMSRLGTVLTAEARLVRAEDDYPFVGGGVEGGVGIVTLWGTAGTWFHEDIEKPAWSVGAQVAVKGLGVLYAAAQQRTNEPLYWNSPHRTWNVGVSRRLGPAGPTVTVADVAPGGGVTFRLPADIASEPPLIAGDFNDWKGVSMCREGDEWVATLPLGPGFYRYAFQRADGTWFVPEDFPGRIDDGFGGSSATILVP